MFSNGLISLINKPTRITKSSITCIDHIYTNSYINHDITAGIVKTDISDHFPIFIVDNNTKTTPFPEQITKKVRIMMDSNILAFKKKLSKTDWSLVLSTNNPDMAYNIFLRTLMHIYDEYFPLQEITIKRKSLLSPWIQKKKKLLINS